MKNPAIIRTSRDHPLNRGYITNIEPQNDTFARDVLIRSDSYNRADAVVLPREIAELIVAGWNIGANRATPGFIIEGI